MPKFTVFTSFVRLCENLWQRSQPPASGSTDEPKEIFFSHLKRDGGIKKTARGIDTNIQKPRQESEHLGSQMQPRT